MTSAATPRSFKVTSAQGDIYITKIKKLPKGAVEVPVFGNHIVVAHSETGHHHVIEADKATMYKLPDSITDCLLVINDETALQHLRDYDKHDPLILGKGVYHVRRQREYTPEGYRMVQD